MGTEICRNHLMNTRYNRGDTLSALFKEKDFTTSYILPTI